MDIVIPVRPGEFNDELRYALRSLSANVPHDRVWIAGHRPRWAIGVAHIPTRQNGLSKYRASTRNLRAAAEHPDVSEEFVLWNDDFYAMQPLDVIPVWNRGRVVDVEADYRARRINSNYAAGARDTRLLLESLGYPDPLSYELHVPMTMTKPIACKALEVGARLPVLHKRTLIGNLAGEAGETRRDVKVDRLDGQFDRESPVLSTLDRSFQRGEVGRFIRSRFPDPSPYEVRRRTSASRTSRLKLA